MSRLVNIFIIFFINFVFIAIRPIDKKRNYLTNLGTQRRIGFPVIESLIHDFNLAKQNCFNFSEDHRKT